MEVLHLVFETEYDDKKDWNREVKTCRTETCRKVNLTKANCKANLHAPRICDVVQFFFVEEFVGSLSGYIPSV